MITTEQVTGRWGRVSVPLDAETIGKVFIDADNAGLLEQECGRLGDFLRFDRYAQADGAYLAELDLTRDEAYNTRDDALAGVMKDLGRVTWDMSARDAWALAQQLISAVHAAGVKYGDVPS